MRARYLLDTNVLVYSQDSSERAKHLRATELLAHLARSSLGSIPAQALAELSSVALRKFRPAADPSQLYRVIEAFHRTFPILPLTEAVVLEAVRGVRDRKLPYYDAQIWAVAKLAQIPFVLSEDFATGSVVEGVTFLDPFAADVQVSSL